MPAPTLILLTGGTGHIGFRILVQALEAGHHVRAAIRSPTKAEPILSNPAITALDLPASALTFITIPDLEVPGAYDEAVKDCTYIIHVASPLPSNHLGASPSEAEALFIRPALQGTLGILASAKKFPSVRRVVITSSVVSLIPAPVFTGFQAPPHGTVYSATSRVPLPKGPYPSLPAAYGASKVASLLATEEWVEREKPSFGIVNVHPGFVLGPDVLNTTAETARKGTNMMVLGIAFGGKVEQPRGGSTVFVDDVARVHVGSLDEEKITVDGTRSFALHVPAVWNNVVEIIGEEYPKAVEKGVLTVQGSQPTMPIDIDVSETEKVFGFKLMPFQEQVRKVLDWYVGLAGIGE